MKKYFLLLLAVGMMLTGCTNASDSESPDANETGGNSGDSDGSSSTS
jgi:protein involved in sex pheromone biosynthesis